MLVLKIPGRRRTLVAMRPDHANTLDENAIVEAIALAIAMFGSQQKLAAACGVSQGAVHKWLYGGRVSAENAVAIERATGGLVSKAALRPDLFGAGVAA